MSNPTKAQLKTERDEWRDMYEEQQVIAASATANLERSQADALAMAQAWKRARRERNHPDGCQCHACCAARRVLGVEA
jgi:hypothetical protein